MIIGINGKIGSGKDTIGEIIQKLCLTNSGSKFEVKKFAGKLKEIGSLLTGVDVEKFEDQEFKKQEMPKCWNKLQQSGRSKVSIPMTYREFLQKLGTEAMRDGLHTNVWVNALFADYKPQPNKEVAEFLAAEGLPQSMNAGEQNYPNWIITDMRFPNEMEAVKERDGITIRVVRYKVGDKVYWIDPEGVSSGIYEIAEVYSDFCVIYNAYSEAQVPYHEIKIHSDNLHASETGLDNATFDYEVLNTGSIDDLVEEIKEILTKENIL